MALWTRKFYYVCLITFKELYFPSLLSFSEKHILVLEYETRFNKLSIMKKILRTLLLQPNKIICTDRKFLYAEIFHYKCLIKTWSSWLETLKLELILLINFSVVSVCNIKSRTKAYWSVRILLMHCFIYAHFSTL